MTSTKVLLLTRSKNAESFEYFEGFTARDKQKNMTNGLGGDHELQVYSLAHNYYPCSTACEMEAEGMKVTRKVRRGGKGVGSYIRQLLH